MSAQTESTTDQVDYTEEELLSDVSCVEPLIANGVRCHGGFDEDGQYRSPRTRFRTPAIAAWQRQLENQGHDLLQISPDLTPPTHPSVAQAKLLLTNGAREPIVRALTIISIVEGFGAMIRDVNHRFQSRRRSGGDGTTALRTISSLVADRSRAYAAHK